MTKINDIVPVKKTWQIGEKEYVQTPLGIDRRLQFIGEGLELFRKLYKGENIKALQSLDPNTPDGAFALYALIVRTLPEDMPRLVALALDTDSPKDIENIRKNGGAVFLKVILEFIKQNDVKGMFGDFLALRDSLMELSLPSESSKENDTPSITTPD